jgi:hypothetical protein
MSNGIDIKGLDDLLKIVGQMSDGIDNLQQQDGQTIIVNGLTAKNDVPIKDMRLSKTPSEAIKEAQYVSSRTQGIVFTSEDQDKINRYIRDWLEKEGKGLF